MKAWLDGADEHVLTKITRRASEPRLVHFFGETKSKRERVDGATLFPNHCVLPGFSSVVDHKWTDTWNLAGLALILFLLSVPQYKWTSD